jgi:hypothetical protein
MRAHSIEIDSCGIKQYRGWFVKQCLHWRRWRDNAGDSDTLVLALASLGKATEIEMILIAKVSKEGDIALRYCWLFFVQTSPM